MIRRTALFIVFSSLPSLAAVAHVKSGQAVNVQASGASLDISFKPAAANDVLIAACLYSGTGQTLAITGGSLTWTPANTLDSQAGSGVAQTYWAVSSGTTTITINCKASTSVTDFMSILVDEFSGASTTSPIDNHKEANATSGSITTTITPVANNCALYGAAWDSLTAVGSGFTKGADDTQQDWSEFKILTGGAGASQTVNFTGSGTWQLLALTIAPPGGGSPTMPPVVY